MTNDDKPKNLEKKSFSVNTSHVQVSSSLSETQPFNFTDLPPPPSVMERQYTCYGNFEIKDNIEEKHVFNNILTIPTELLKIYIEPFVGEQSMLPNDHNIETWDVENLLLGSLKELPTP